MGSENLAPRPHNWDRRIRQNQQRGREEDPETRGEGAARLPHPLGSSKGPSSVGQQVIAEWKVHP
eukprot:gene17518-5469_t